MAITSTPNTTKNIIQKPSFCTISTTALILFETIWFLEISIYLSTWNIPYAYTPRRLYHPPFVSDRNSDMERQFSGQSVFWAFHDHEFVRSMVISLGMIFFWLKNSFALSPPAILIVETGSCITDAVSILDTESTALTINQVNGTMSIPVTSFGSMVFIS